MSGTAADVARAEASAKAARAQLNDTVGTLQERLKPAALLREAREGARDRAELLAGQARDRAEVLTGDAIAAARARPQLAAGAAGALVLLVLRKPLTRLFRRLFRRKPSPTAALPSGSVGI